MARRLLVPVTLLFLALLVLGSLAPSDQATRDTTRTLPAPDGPPPRRVEATLPTRGDEVRARVGDLVTLTVESERVGGVEVPGFGVSEPVAPEAPARFDLLPTRPGRYPVRAVETGTQLGVLVVDAES